MSSDLIGGYLRFYLNRPIKWADFRLDALLADTMLTKLYTTGPMTIKLADGFGVRLVAFADDLAVMAMAATTDDLMNLVDGALKWVNEWMRGAGLRLAARKTEAVLLTGKRRPGRVTFHIGGEEIV
jgi:hypothetical protein